MVRCGDRLAHLRDKRGLTQEELSVKLGISRAALSHYETNRREPDYDTVRNIADFFDISLDYLLGRTNVPQSHFPVKAPPARLELTDEDAMGRLVVTVDGRELTMEETKRFIAFVRAERALNKV